MTHLTENSVLNKGANGKGPMSGTIIAQGGAISGWSFYVKDGKAKFTYNLLGLQMFTTEAKELVPPCKHQVRAEFAYDGGGVAKGGDVSLYYDGEKVGEGRVEATQPFAFSADEGIDIGRETGTIVAPDYGVKSSEFSGEIDWVELKVGGDDHSHMVDPEQLIHVLMTRH